MPSQAFIPLSALMGSAAVVNICKFNGALEHKGGQVIWRSWQDFLGVLGIAMLPQVHKQKPQCGSSLVSLSWQLHWTYTVSQGVFSSASTSQHITYEKFVMCCLCCRPSGLSAANTTQCFQQHYPAWWLWPIWFWYVSNCGVQQLYGHLFEQVRVNVS